ncbi:MAG: hypothetical protein WCS37_09740 [Chloroflexota bacterium]|nr:hypothetical protein [Chloroflexota bacterium]
MDIDYLIDRLEALLTSGKRVPLSNKVMVDEQECLDLIDQMRTVVPQEVKAAKRTLLDRERILNDAEEDSRQIIGHAEQERERILSHEGMLAETERRRDEIIGEATQEAYELREQAQAIYNESVGQTQEMREGANGYTMQVLQELETLLSKHLGMVRNGLQSFQQQAQQYHEQMETYQRQNRPNYAPPGPPPETRSATRTRAGRPNEDLPTSAEPPPTTERRPAANPTSPERKPSGSGTLTNRRTPAQPPPPERRTSAAGTSPLTGRGVTPVPKPNRPGEAEDADGLDDDDFLNPERDSNPAPRRSSLPNTGTNRPTNRNDY